MCFFANVKGVCDTPLHIFVYFMGDMMVVEHAFSLPSWPYARALDGYGSRTRVHIYTYR